MPERETASDALTDDLERVAGGRGFRTWDVRASGPLRELGFRAVKSKPREDSSATGLRIALVSAIELLDSRGIRVGGIRRAGYSASTMAAAALALPPYDKIDENKMERQNRAASDMDLKHGGTVRKWQRSALSAVADVLLEFADRPDQLSAELAPQLGAASPRQRQSPPFDITWQKLSYHFDEEGHMTEHQADIAVIATAEVVSSLPFWHEFFDDSSSGVFKVTSFERCQLLGEDFHNGAHRAEFSITPAIKMGMSKGISYRLGVHSKVRSAPRVRGTRVRTVDDRQSQMSIQFNPRYCPQKIWWYVEEGLKGGEYLPVLGQALQVDESGYVENLFPPLKLSEKYGLAWQWPQVNVE